MEDHRQDRRYEELYSQLFERGLDMHVNNKKRIKDGLILLVILPVILEIIRRLTESDKIFFLIIWVFCMFITCIYLISIEYIDDSIQKTLRDVTDREADFDELFMGTEQIGEKLSERRENRQRKLREILGSKRPESEDEE